MSKMSEIWANYSLRTGLQSDDDRHTFFTGAAAALQQLIQRGQGRTVDEMLGLLLEMTFELEEAAK